MKENRSFGSESYRYRGSIPPAPEGQRAPLWSVMIPTYNCATYLKTTLASVLAQDPGPEVMQIEVIDDHSTNDNPLDVVKEVGCRRIGFYRQAENVGHTRNFETCLKRSRGQLIHLLHGDDYVRDGFYKKMQDALLKNIQIGAAFCRQIFMDEFGHWQSISPLEQMQSGILNNGLERLALEQRIMTPSIVVRRTVYEELGGFDNRLLCSEDWEMWMRIAASYPLWYEVEPLAVYRMHSISNTGRHIRTGEDILYTCQAIDIFKSYLPDNIANKVSKKAKETYALSALDTAWKMSIKCDWVAMMAQIRAAHNCSRSFRIIRKIIKLWLWSGIHWIRQKLGGANQ